MEESPGEGADIVEESEGVVGSVGVDRACSQEELEVGIDLFCRGVGDPPVVVSIPA
jgi:hypothetical protein